MELVGQELEEQAEFIFVDLLESTILDIASEAHRAAHLGLDPRLNIDEEEEYKLSSQARLSLGDASGHPAKKSKHGMVDIFGQTHPAVAKEVFECMSCRRKVMAGRFAPHLEKCMGKGRRGRSYALGNKKSDLPEKTEKFQKTQKVQKVSKTIQKVSKTITIRASLKVALSKKRAHENGFMKHRKTSQYCRKEIKRVLDKATRRLKQKTLTNLSRRSVRQA